jgi:hypothetical protein
MTITTGMILDVVVILLLVPTIIYAIILNRRLTALRRSREELSKVVASFNEATMRAEAGIPKLKKATTEANHTLKDRVEKAQTLRDDLAFMIERAEELAGRLEGAVSAARNEGLMTHGPAVAPANAAAPSRTLTDAPSPQRGYQTAGAGMASAAPGTLTAATLAQTAAGFEETAAELRHALGTARAEARVAEARSGGAVTGTGIGGMSGTGLSSAMAGGAMPPRSRAINTRDLGESGLPPTRRAIGERSLADRAVAPEVVDEERSEAERELLKALQSAR